MVRKFKSWLFRKLYPQQYALMYETAKLHAEGDLKRKYEQLLQSTMRSPLDESVWVRKFTTLDDDYTFLEKELQESRAQCMQLRGLASELEGRLLYWREHERHTLNPRSV